MRRIIFSILLCVGFLASASAEKPYKFPLDSEGNVEIQDTIAIDVTKSDCYRIIKEWLYTISCVSLSFSNEKKNESLTFNNVFYAQKRYNSFSGSYSDNLSIDCDMKIEEGKLIYRIYNIQLIKAYAGYGATSSTYPVAERIHKIDRAQNEINRLNADKNISKTDRRDAIAEQQEIMNDSEVLAKCYDVMQARFNNLRKMVKWDAAPQDED